MCIYVGNIRRWYKLYFNLFFRIAKTRERATGNGNVTFGNHRHRHRNPENGTYILFAAYDL